MELRSSLEILTLSWSASLMILVMMALGRFRSLGPPPLPLLGTDPSFQVSSSDSSGVSTQRNITQLFKKMKSGNVQVKGWN